MTVLQPAPYMQNFTAHPRELPLRVPYRIDAEFSLVDLADVAQVAARVLTEDGHDHATYELPGAARLTIRDVARGLGVPAQAQALTEWRTEVRAHGMPDYAVDSLTAMFRFYDACGLVGNPRVLTSLLDRPPATLAEVIRRIDARDRTAGREIG